MALSIGANTLGGIFSTNKFKVPAYQRAYAWSKPQLRDFLADLLGHPAGTKRAYFMGTVLLTESSHQDDVMLTQYEIVDGQQRLTTTTIFVGAAVARLAPAASYDDIRRMFYERFLFSSGKHRLFRTVDEDDAFFERFIVGMEVPGLADCHTPSQHRLRDARLYFSSRMAEFSPDQVSTALTTLFRSNILIYAVDSPVEATQIFEFQNDRGKRLTNLEALKSFLMHQLYLHGEDTVDSELRFVQSQFAILYRAFEQIEDLPISPNEDQILGYHCAAYLPPISIGGEEGWRKPKELVRHLLEAPGMIGVNSASQWVKGFAASLADSFVDCLNILIARDRLDPLSGLFVVGRVAIFWPLLIKAWRMRGAQTEGAFSAAVREMERFASRASLASLRADTGEPRLRFIANAFDGDLEQLTPILANLRTEWSIPDRFARALDDPNYYNGGTASRYVLWRYENHLRSLPGCQEPKLPWTKMMDKSSSPDQYGADHILPRESAPEILGAMTKWNPADDAEPLKRFDELYLHRLGNLVLDTRSTGSSKGNKNFNERVPHYQRSSFISQKEVVSKFANGDALGEWTWDEQAIRTRHAALREFALQHL